MSNKVFDILSILYSRIAINILAFLQFILNPNEFASYGRAYPAWNCYHGLFLSRETAVEKLKEQNDIEGKAKPVLLRLKELLSTLGEMDASCALEYALLYLPVNMYKVWHPLKELLMDDRLPILDEYKYQDGAHPIRILEMGAGPGTATLGVLSFYALLAEINPSLKIVIEYVPVEYEKAFHQIFDALTGALLKTLPSNLQVKLKPMQLRNAFDFIRNYPAASFDLVLESNMLNQNERVDAHQLRNLLGDLNKVLVYSGKFIAIEPADAGTAAFLNEIAGKWADYSGFAVMGPKIVANDVSAIGLYQDACECHLRHALEKDQHMFRFAVLTKVREGTL